VSAADVPPGVLDLFAMTAPVQALPGGQGRSVHAGDLVLSPGRDARVLDWLCPVLVPLAVRLDERPRRHPRDLRIAVPVPARDGRWVVQGWSASRYEPGTVACTDLAVLLAAGRVLHAELGAAVHRRPAVLDGRIDRWARAEALAWGPAADARAAAAGTAVLELVDRLLRAREPWQERAQLVHADLAGNVLIDARGAPVVIDVAPYWRPVLWAEAVTVLDAVLWLGAPQQEMVRWLGSGQPARRQAMLRAALFRVLSDEPCDVEAHLDLVPLLTWSE